MVVTEIARAATTVNDRLQTGRHQTGKTRGITGLSLSFISPVTTARTHQFFILFGNYFLSSFKRVKHQQRNSVNKYVLTGEINLTLFQARYPV